MVNVNYQGFPNSKLTLGEGGIYWGARIFLGGVGKSKFLVGGGDSPHHQEKLWLLEMARFCYILVLIES